MYTFEKKGIMSGEIETPCFHFSSLAASAYRPHALPRAGGAAAAAGQQQRTFGGGRFFGRFLPREGSADAAEVPTRGGSFLVWRVHRLKELLLGKSPLGKSPLGGGASSLRARNVSSGCVFFLFFFFFSFLFPPFLLSGY